MKWVLLKKISLFIILTGAVLGNIFATNTQTFSLNTERCELENLYTNPCAVVSIDGTIFEIEQELNSEFYYIDINTFDFEYASLVQRNIPAVYSDYILYYARDFDPPSSIELARSHVIIS